MIPTISIIVPVYNVADYLPCCMESILSQTFTDFEVLLVDDGSTDGGGDICDRMAEKDSRIRVFHKANGGVSSARNLGLENARGAWVFFLDSDDLLPDRALEMLMAHADDDSDMVLGAIRKFNDEDADIETISVDRTKQLSIDEALDAFVFSTQRNGDWHRYLFNRIYRMSVIQDFRLRFLTDVYYKEDGVFVVQYLCRCRKGVFCIPDVVYLYRQIPTSAMGSLATTYNQKLLTNIDSHGYIYRELKRYGASKDVIDRELGHMFQNYDWIGGIMRLTGFFTKENKRLLIKRIMKNAGPMETFNRFVILRFGRKIQRKMRRILKPHRNIHER